MCVPVLLRAEGQFHGEEELLVKCNCRSEEVFFHGEVAYRRKSGDDADDDEMMKR